jgi:hypothetical protein
MKRSPIPLRELAVYALVAASSLFLMTFVVHMLVGGLVSETTERWLTVALCSAVALLIGAMAWDVARRRSAKHSSDASR